MISRITTGKLARLIMNCKDAIRVKKNRNSHGATVGSTICQLSLIISSLSKASASELDPNFIELIPHDGDVIVLNNWVPAIDYF